MNNPYISYKVIGDKFTYKRFNKDNIVVEEELPLFENGKINSAASQIVVNVREKVKEFEKNKQDREKKEKIEDNIKLSPDEFNIIDKFMLNEGTEIEKDILRKKLEEIENKYKISFLGLRSVYKTEKNNSGEKLAVQIDESRKQLEINKLEKNKEEAKKIIASFPNDITNDEITALMEEIEGNLNIPKENLFDLYKAGKELKQSNIKQTKTATEIFQEKVDEISKEEMLKIAEFLNANPPTLESFVQVSNIKKKYDLSDKDIILAYSVKMKQLEKTSKHKVVRNSKLQTARTGKKLEFMIQELKDKELSTKELAIELDKMCKKYNISQLQMELLYSNAILSKQKDELSKKVSKKLTGQKITHWKKTKTNLLEDSLLNTTNSKQDLIDSGYNFVIVTKKEDWIEMVEKNQSNPVPIYTAVNIMNILENGGGIHQARKELERSHNFLSNKGAIIKLVSEYSPYGQEFERRTRKYIMTNPERLANFILDKKVSFKKSENKMEVDFDTEDAIKKLEELRKYIIKPEALGIDNVIEPPSPWKMM